MNNLRDRYLTELARLLRRRRRFRLNREGLALEAAIR